MTLDPQPERGVMPDDIVGRISPGVFAGMLVRGRGREDLKDGLRALLDSDMDEREVGDEIRSALEEILPDEAMPEVRVTW